MDVQELASEARKSISNFCIYECNAYCCRKGYLVLSVEELDFLVLDKRADLENKEFIKPQEKNTFSLNLGNHLGSCPRLINSKCSIHKDSRRPLVCDTFPVFVNEERKEIRLSPRCFAVKENKLYPYINEFLKLGYKVNHIG